MSVTTEATKDFQKGLKAYEKGNYKTALKYYDFQEYVRD
jgi:hypothetical protein